MKKFCLEDSGVSEITEIRERYSPDPSVELRATVSDQPLGGWILYDADCRSCTRAATALSHMFNRRGFLFLPLQTPWVSRHFGLTTGAPAAEMHVLTTAGDDYGGADAVIFLAGKVWWTWPLFVLGRLPRVHDVIARAYRWVAAHRGCNHLSCKSSRPHQWPGWIALVALPPLALLIRNRVSPWVLMWLVAAALFFGCKWLTFWRALQQGTHLHFERLPGYFLFWPGMDATNFLTSEIRRGNLSEHARRIVASAIQIVTGALALFLVARLASIPLLAGWIGMLGMILMLHFGFFRLTAVAWQIAGVDAQPIMDTPIKASSLSDFWGRRWNGAFNQLDIDVLFRPLARSTGAALATIAVFLFSGALHELVISIPARAGYGLPTAYFLLQGSGVLAQRRFRLRHSAGGWFVTMIVVAAPAFWLFHPPFVRHVILPFMKAIHAF
jgi:predicted DCC family thiol-disulfide oxidoreductase YuxK